MGEELPFILGNNAPLRSMYDGIRKRKDINIMPFPSLLYKVCCFLDLTNLVCVPI